MIIHLDIRVRLFLIEKKTFIFNIYIRHKYTDHNQSKQIFMVFYDFLFKEQCRFYIFIHLSGSKSFVLWLAYLDPNHR
jgi:hypothetical protein